MMQYWNNLNERERLLLGVGISIIMIYLFYLLIYSPLSNAVQTKALQLSEKQSTLAWMKDVHKQIKKETASLCISNTKLLSLIDNQLREEALKKFPYQLQQTSSGEIQLSFERVPFNLFLSWLWKLHKDYSITLKQLDAGKTETPGIIHLNIVITTKD